MKYLILGGGGFLGSHLSDALLAQGHSVRIFDRPNLRRYREFLASEAVEWLEGDFDNKDDLAQAVPGCDVIFHLISTTLPKSSNDNPVYDVQTNVIGTLHLLELARRESVRKLVFVSSGGTVYGVPKQVPIKESHPTDPVCSYGITKLAIEKYLGLYHSLHGLDYCVLRVANPYGERQRVNATQGAVTVFLHKALRNETIEIWGDGSVVRDYIYVGDFVDAALKACSCQGDQRVFNIGAGKGKSLNDVLAAVESLLGAEVQRRYVSSRSFDVPTNVLDISLAKEALHWHPTIPFREGLSRTMNWLQPIELKSR